MTHIVWWGWSPDENSSMENHGITIYKEFFPEPEFTYHYDIRTLPPDTGAILVISACISEPMAHHLGIVPPIQYGENVDRLNRLTAIKEAIYKMPWVIIMIAQDEDAHVLFNTLVHPRMKIWVQVPKPPVTSTHPGLWWAAKCGNHVRRLPMGYDSLFKSLVSYQPSFTERPVDWMFKGACTLDRHGQWLIILQNLANHPQPLKTEHALFIKYENREAECIEGTCLPIDEYIRMHTQSKVVICRPEAWNPCPARVFYVLQAGCIPIVSEKPSVKGGWYSLYDWNGWWEYMLGEKPPFPVVKDVNDLPEILRQTLNEWPENGKRVYGWWIDYKARLGASLRAEIAGIQK